MWLFDNRLVECVLFTNEVGFRDLFGCPFAGAPVEDETFSDKPIEGATGLFHWGFDVGSVAETDVDVVLLESG